MFKSEHLEAFLFGAVEAGKRCDGSHQKHQREPPEPLPGIEHTR
jgi:hypothetical protein